MSTLLDLSRELQEIILLFLPAVDLSSMEMCSSSLRDLVVGHDLWRKRAELLVKLATEHVEKKVQELEEGNKPRICEIRDHLIGAEVLRFYTHRGCGGVVCTECLTQHMSNGLAHGLYFCLLCGGDMEYSFDELEFEEDEESDEEYEEYNEEDYHKEFNEGNGFDDRKNKGSKKEHAVERKVIEEKHEMRDYKEKEDERANNVEAYVENWDVESLNVNEDVMENKEMEEAVVIGENNFIEVADHDCHKDACCIKALKPDPIHWEPSAQELIEVEISRGKRLQEVLSGEGNGKKVLKRLLEVMMEEPAPYKNMARKEKGLK